MADIHARTVTPPRRPVVRYADIVIGQARALRIDASGPEKSRRPGDGVSTGTSKAFA